ncbi:MAG: prepilin-type N-terminal cleavage/methylation domain-containing protein [Candidatus Omnitrophica bacterium]|nr:prepilin-type N-terminal cleavage/methylation domain-containing protein [Candidatus Omnitrophota bacterium]
MKKTFQKKAGFTLVELMLAVFILAFTLSGLIRVFLQCSTMNEIALSKTAAMIDLQGKMEEIRNYDYGSIATDYVSGGAVGDTFDLSQLTGKGVIYIDAGNPKLLEIKIVASWQNQGGRVIGGDLNLDGVLDAGETVDADGDLASIATLITKIAQRQ